MSKVRQKPSFDYEHLIDRGDLAPNLVIGTSIGLRKELNEDAIAARVGEGVVRVCVADGHWGEGAAQVAVPFWMDPAKKFPVSKVGSQRQIAELQAQLFQAYGKPDMNAERDFTPETAFIAAEVEGDVLRVVGYGDCRLLLVRGGKKQYSFATKETWLGAFSSLGLRNRVPAEQGVIFNRRRLLPGDCLLMYTDGLDQCIYEEETIDEKTIAAATERGDPADIFERLMAQAFEFGAEDNISLAIWTMPSAM